MLLVLLLLLPFYLIILVVVVRIELTYHIDITIYYFAIRIFYKSLNDAQLRLETLCANQHFTQS